MFEYRSGRAVDFVLVLHVAAFELNLVFEPTVVNVALNLKFIDIRGVNSGVSECGGLCRFLADVGGNDGVVVGFVMLVVMVDCFGLEFDNFTGGVNIALVFDVSYNELELVLDDSVVMVDLGLREDGILNRNSGVLKCCRLRGFKPDVGCLFRSRRCNDCFVSGVALLFLFDYRAGVGVDLILVLNYAIVYINVIVRGNVIYV